MQQEQISLASGVERGVRDHGQWSFWQARKNDALYRAIWLGLWVADALPERLLLKLGRLLGRIWYFTDFRGRTRAIERAESCLGTRADSTVRQSFINAGENLALCLLLRRPGVNPSRFVGLSDDVARTLCGKVATGQRTIFVSAHLGPFELLAARVAALGAKPAVVVRESYDPRLDPLVDKHRWLRGVQVIHRGKPGAATSILRAIYRHQPVGFLIDLESRVRSASLPFLGKASMIPLGPQLLALRTGARVLVGTLQRRTPGLRPLPYFDLKVECVRAAEDIDEDAILLTQRVTSLLEREILLCPSDWLWMA